MAVPYVPTTHVDGVAGGFDAADANHLELGVRDAQLAPAVRVFHNAAQAIANATDVALAFNSERIDQFAGSASTMHDTVTNNSRLTAQHAGVFLIGASGEWSANPGNTRVGLRLNGATIIDRVQHVVADMRAWNIVTLYALAVNDYVEVIVQQNSGGSININSSANYSPEFWMTRVG